MAKNVVLICMDCARRDFFPQFTEFAAPVDSVPKLTEWLEAKGAQAIPAISHSSCTAISIPSIFTGLLPSEHGVTPALSARLPSHLSLITDLRFASKLGVSSNPYTSKFFNYDVGFDVWEDLSSVTMGEGEVKLTTGSWPTNGEHVNKAVQALQLKEPFFLYAHFMDAHYPTNMDNEGRITQGDLLGVRERSRKFVRTYAVGMMGLDEQVSRLVSYLDSIVSVPTVYILFADHGEELYSPPRYIIGHSWGLSQSLIKVPLFIVGAHITYTHYFGLMNILPWILSGLDETIDFGMHRVVSQLIPPVPVGGDPRKLRQWVSVLEEDRKYVLEVKESEREFFYMLGSDPCELVNVIDLHRSKIQSMIKCAQSHVLISSGTTAAGQVEIPNAVQQRLEALGYL